MKTRLIIIYSWISCVGHWKNTAVPGQETYSWPTISTIKNKSIIKNWNWTNSTPGDPVWYTEWSVWLIPGQNNQPWFLDCPSLTPHWTSMVNVRSLHIQHGICKTPMPLPIKGTSHIPPAPPHKGRQFLSMFSNVMICCTLHTLNGGLGKWDSKVVCVTQGVVVHSLQKMKNNYQLYNRRRNISIEVLHENSW